MRVALLEVSHWHFPLYEPVLASSDVDVVAVSDRSSEVADGVAYRFNAASYRDFRHLIAEQEIDFAFVFGVHRDMPVIARALLERSIAFSIEKPCGTSLRDVSEICRIAEEKRIFVSIAFVYRLSPVLDFIKSVEGQLPAIVSHFSIRNVAGSPQRYLDAGVPWMLEKDAAGGGCLINVGTHFIDLVHVVTQSEPTLVHSTLSNDMHKGEVEDYALLVMETTSGAQFVLEVGYTFPHSEIFKREFSLTYSSQKAYIQSTEDSLQAFMRDCGASQQHVLGAVNLDTDVYFAPYIQETLKRFRQDEEPVAGLRDMYRVMSVIEQAYVSNNHLCE